jgi:hypothetical protein
MDQIRFFHQLRLLAAAAAGKRVAMVQTVEVEVAEVDQQDRIHMVVPAQQIKVLQVEAVALTSSLVPAAEQGKQGAKE